MGALRSNLAGKLSRTLLLLSKLALRELEECEEFRPTRVSERTGCLPTDADVARTRTLKTQTTDSTTNAIRPQNRGALLGLWAELRSGIATTINSPIRITWREEEVLACLLLRFRDKEIADVIGVSSATVKTYVRQLLRKCGTRSRRELVTKLLQQ
jgi:DNA-binding CsgD family transcriptional regulator